MLSNSLLLLKDNFIIKGVKDISFALDKLVYSLASSAYKVFLIIGNIRLTGGGVMTKIMMRLYGVISLFMIFVLAYNLLLYIIDPDKMTDNKVGGVSILKKIIIALVIIVASPTAFDTLYDACQKVLEARVVENIVLGGYAYTGSSGASGTAQNYAAANQMIVDVYTAFLYPNPTQNTIYSSSDCINNTSNDYCIAYNDAITKESLDPFEPIIDNTKTSNDFHYSFFISTISGVLLFLFLLGYAINLAMRAGKLAVLEMIAPIPALMDLIPNKSGATERWIKAVLSTFAQVFIYQATIFFIVWLISLIPDTLNGAFEAVFEATNGNGTIVKLFAKILIIFGLLKVGKELPKYIGDILGIKMEGASVGGVLKGALGFGAGVAGAGVLAAGALKGGIRNAVASGRDGKGFLRGAGSFLAGTGSGLVRNAWGARNVRSFSDARQLSSRTAETVQARRATREAYRNLHGGTWRGAVKGHASDIRDNALNYGRNLVGAQSEYAKQKAQDEALTQFKGMYNDGIASIWKNDATWARYKELYERAKTENQPITIDGKTYDATKLKSLMDQRKNALVNTAGNQEKIRDTLVRMRAYAATRQGIDGIPDIKIFEQGGELDINKQRYTATTVRNMEEAGGIIDDADTILKGLQTNPKYAANKAKENQAAAQRQAIQEAEQNANKNNSGK